ncbi:type II toxin-antitoxin system HicA family toxin [Roseicella aerolata]|uniref:Type II toxin-antitoxin system HicA family toxin n=1 Tax=Roseicella aerolata TaxID=2883479 RepID=A0A9X1L9K3_9PROT|nr:type II toxin-antitoxin system HicA family toxin [Roseicella aerolata]
MARLEKVVSSFKQCQGPFSWREFTRMIVKLGYEEKRSGKTSGSQRVFFHSGTQDVIMAHEPHDGEMGPSMVRRLRSHLEQRGII